MKNVKYFKERKGLENLKKVKYFKNLKKLNGLRVKAEADIEPKRASTMKFFCKNNRWLAIRMGSEETFK